MAVYAFQPLGSVVHPDMRAVYESNRALIYAHIFGALFALLLGPVQFSRRLRERAIGFHRLCGRLYLGVGVLVGGGAGLVMSFMAYGGLAARAGFFTLAALWLFSGFQAYRTIRRGDVAAHRRWMIRNFAMTFAAVTLRAYLPSAMGLGLDFAVSYAVIAWLCWVPNVAVAELLVRRPASSPAS